MKTKLIAASIAVVTFFGGYFVWQTLATTDTKDCVTVYIDYGILKNDETTTQCVKTTGKTNALDVLSAAGVAVEGTEKYGSAVACRVNSLPSSTTPLQIEGQDSYLELCNEMPAAFAYWAVFVKEGTDVPNPLDASTKWNWAQTGINEVVLENGDAIGLVFADNENVDTPR